MRSRSASRLRESSAGIYVLVALGVLAWLWPIGVGGAMPVGGDVTQFSLGLMAFLRDSLHASRLPYWNDLWGYGFPGIAESQMGVYYPPHWLLYGLLPLEVAYTSSLVIHMIWAGWGAAWAARVMGVSRAGALLSGLAFGTSGWFLIHLPHQWGATTGSWMPWVWGLAYAVSDRSETRRPSWLILAAALTMQVLPGHFQMGFITQVGVGLIALARCGERNVRGALRIALALGFMLPLAGAQLLPTLDLSQLAAGRRDFEYLSGFASPPTHMLSLIAPSLFHDSPLWRPLIWDPFHAMPEEHQPYVGLAPLFLAVVAVIYSRRQSREVRCLTLLVVGMWLLCMGPYVPGFSLLIQLPGFSFFRAPARWGLGMLLGIALLAGRGFDLVASLVKVRKGIQRFVLIAVILISLGIGLFELVLFATEGSGSPGLIRLLQPLSKLAPWPPTDSLTSSMAAARLPQLDLRVQTAEARRGRLEESIKTPQLVRQRFWIYRDELVFTSVGLLGLLGLSCLRLNPRRMQYGLLALGLCDTWCLATRRPIDLAPIGSLVSRSPVLTALANLPRGTRSIDPMGNLAMIAGAGPISAYRTLDLPAWPALTLVAKAPLSRVSTAPDVASAMEVAGTGVRVLDPFEMAELQRLGRLPPGWSRLEPVRDSHLAGWLYGNDWARIHDNRASVFGLLYPDSPAHQWRVTETDRFDPNDPLLYRKLAGLPSLVSTTLAPERVEVEAHLTETQSLLGARLYHPQWVALWSGDGGERTGISRRLSQGWQNELAPSPLPMDHHVRLSYVPGVERRGQLISLGSWLVWLVGMIRVWWVSRHRVRSKIAGSDCS